MRMMRSASVERDGALKAYLAIPVMSEMPPEVAVAVSEARMDCHISNIDLTVGVLAGNCHVDDGRNYLVRDFLKTDCAEFLFLDADVVPKPADIVKILKSKHDVIAGIYPYKSDDDDRIFPYVIPPGSVLYADDEGAIEVGMVPTGFLKIRRSVLQRLYDMSDKFWGRNEELDEMPMGIVFERTFVPFSGQDRAVRWGGRAGQRIGGDYSFCAKVGKLGLRIHADPEIALGHIGPKQFRDHFGMHLAKRNNVDHPRFVAAVRAVIAGTPEPAAWRDLHFFQGNPWSACPEMYMACYEAALAAGGPVIETGSGITTLMLGIAADEAGVEVHTLEHSLPHLMATQALLDRYGVKSVRLHYAPLRFYDGAHPWYEIPPGLPHSFALAVNDGPPRHANMRSRQGFYTLLADRIADAHWIADDADCPADLAEFEHYATEAGRTATVLGDNDKRRCMVAARPLQIKEAKAA